MLAFVRAVLLMTVLLAAVRLLADCTELIRNDRARWAAIEEQADLIQQDAARAIAQPGDLAQVYAAVSALRQAVRARRDAVERSTAG